MEGPLFHGWSRTWQVTRRKGRKKPPRIAAPGGYSRAFEKSRDLWKAKYKTLQERLKAFRTEVRDLRRSRDRWRAKAEALEQETNRLRARLQQQVEQSPPRRAGGYNRS